MIKHIWKGIGISDSQLYKNIEILEDEIDSILKDNLSTEDVILACESVSDNIKKGKYPHFIEALKKDDCENPQLILDALSTNLSRKALEKKLLCELSTTSPFEIKKSDFTTNNFEAWKPMGVLVHITAGNSPIVAPMAAVEGLLTGNINIIKTSSNTGFFPLVFLEELSKYSNLKSFIFLFAISSKESVLLQKMLDSADCVSAWGSENAIDAIRTMVPKGIPVVSWGHRISFSYITKSQINQATADELAKSICRNNQQSCSSPQSAFRDTDSQDDILEFAGLLAKSLEHSKSLYPIPEPDIHQQAEISAISLQHKTDMCFNAGDTIEDDDFTYKILINYTTQFMPSPLFRTIWLSPLKQESLASTIRAMRGYLQTAGLSCDISELERLSNTLYRGGVTRITPIGSMSESYSGEPHDGVYALPRFMKRVSLRTTLPIDGISDFSMLKSRPQPKFTSEKIKGKSDYPSVPENGTRILMKSGGTTGDPVYCSYSQNDYQAYIVEAGAKALLCAGLEPQNDVTADLLKAGNLYGGMNCFISIFDHLKAPHLNISGLEDYNLAADYIIKGRANALLGAPSYIIRILKDNEKKFLKYGRLQKVFFGGEAFSKAQIDYIRNTFGINHIQSMLYGANETGTMGYSCSHCDLNEFHLCSDIQILEILKLDSDEPCTENETGRMLFTGFKKENCATQRYEIGDLGCFISGDCACGSKEPRFKLQGRYGDVIRVGGTFFNYQKIVSILSQNLKYSGRLQLILEKKIDREIMTFRMENIDLTRDKLEEVLFESGYDSFLKTVPTKLLQLNLEIVNSDEYIMNKTSMKLRNIIDNR
ncbi:MAG: aldehyde dehydrogenase family protein [Proteocatella sp.]